MPGDEKFRPSPAEARSYADRAVAKDTNAADMAIAGINTSGAVIRELLSCAKSNPIIGVILSLIVTDVAFRAKIIDGGTKNVAFACIVAAFGVTVTMDVITGIVSAVEGGGTRDTNLIAPSGTTFVDNPPAAGNASTPNRGGGFGALLSRLGPESALG